MGDRCKVHCTHFRILLFKLFNSSHITAYSYYLFSEDRSLDLNIALKTLRLENLFNLNFLVLLDDGKILPQVFSSTSNYRVCIRWWTMALILTWSFFLFLGRGTVILN